MKRIMRSRNDWGASDETLLRRWQVKWKANHPVYLAAARDRAESLRRAAEARSWVQTLRQWDETIKALQNSPTLRQWDEVLKGLQNSPTLRQWNEVLKGLQNSPAWRGSTAIAARAAFAQRAGGQHARTSVAAKSPEGFIYSPLFAFPDRQTSS
ncbi:MAG: hypothetical protein WA231_21535 [Methylocella sp.]